MILTKYPFTGEGWVCWVLCCGNAGRAISGHVLRMYLLCRFIISGKGVQTPAEPQVEMRTMPFLSSDQLQFLVSRHGIHHVNLESQNFKMHSGPLAPLPWPPCICSHQGTCSPFFQFPLTSCSQPRPPVTISLYSLKRRLLGQNLTFNLLVNSLVA